MQRKDSSPDVSAADARRRQFVMRAAYVAPAIVTLAATPAYVKAGSGKHGKPNPPRKPKKKD